MALTVKQEKFCNYYVESGNASEAYRKAYNADSMKADTVNVKASELLANGKITVRVKQLQRELQSRSDITKDEAIRELTHIVRSRVTGVLNAKGKTVTVKSLSELPDEIVSCIQSVKSVKGGIEVKFYDKISAIDRLSKMLGWDEATKFAGEMTLTSQLERLSDDELNTIINNGGKLDSTT